MDLAGGGFAESGIESCSDCSTYQSKCVTIRINRHLIPVHGRHNYMGVAGYNHCNHSLLCMQRHSIVTQD